MRLLMVSLLVAFLRLPHPLAAQDNQNPSEAPSLLLERPVAKKAVPLECLALSGDGSQVAGGYKDGKIIVWDTVSGTVLQEYWGHGQTENRLKYLLGDAMDPLPVTCLLFGRSDQGLLSGGSDGSLRLWDCGLRKTKWRLVSPAQSALEAKMPLTDPGANTQLSNELLENSPAAVDASADGTMIVSASRKTVTVWDAPKGVIVARLEGHKTFVTSVSLSPDSESLVSGSLDGTVRVWEVKTGRQLKKIGEEHGLVIDEVCPQKVIWSEDGRSVAVAYDRSRVMVLSTDTWLTVAWCGQAAHASTVHFANEGTGLVFAAESPRSRIVKWDITSNRTDHFSASSAHDDIWYMSLSRNGTRLATAGKEGKIAIWNLDAVHWVKSSR